LIDREGQYLVENSTALGKEGKQLVEIILDLSKVAQIVGTMHQDDCAGIHVEGENLLFSIYIAGDHIIAFFTDLQIAQEITDFTEMDDKMKDIVDELIEMAG